MDAPRFQPGDVAVINCTDPRYTHNNGIMVKIEALRDDASLRDHNFIPGVYWSVRSLGKPLQPLVHAAPLPRRRRVITAHQSVLHKLVSAPAPADKVAQPKPRTRRARTATKEAA